MPNLIEINETIQLFEKDAMYHLEHIETKDIKISDLQYAEKIILYGPNVQYALALYLSEGKTYDHTHLFSERLERVWVLLFERLMQEYEIFSNIPINTEFLAYKFFFVNSYKRELENYELKLKKVKENDEAFSNGNMSFQNSSHLQEAVKYLNYLIESAKKLWKQDTIDMANRKIHAFQAG